jgi:O-antigen/teichoic acid export membrane protein
LYLVVAALQMACAALATPLITRALGAPSFGRVAVAMAIMQILGPLLSLGLQTGVQKEHTRPGGTSVARALLGFTLIAASASGGVLMATSPWWRAVTGLQSTGLLLIATGWGVLAAPTSVALSLLRAQSRLALFTAISLVQAAGGQICGFAGVLIVSRSAGAYLLGLLVGQLAALCVSVAVLRPRLSGFGGASKLRRVLAFSLPLVPQQLGGLILMAGDRLVVQHDIGARATARYAVAYAVGSLAMALVTLVNQAWLPRMFALGSAAARRKLTEEMRAGLECVAAPSTLALCVGAPVMLKLWAPASYDPSGLGLVASVVAVTTAANVAFVANLWGVLDSGRTPQLALATVAAAVLNIGLNIVLVPMWGITGSAAATTVSYGALAWGTRLASSREVRLPGRRPAVALLSWTTIALGLGSAELPASSVWLGARTASAVLLAGAGLGIGRWVARGRLLGGGGEERDPPEAVNI